MVIAESHRLHGEFDENYHLISTGGAEYVLKIMRADCDAAFLDLLIRALDHLKNFPVPRTAGPIEKTGDGRFKWTLHWLPGTQLADVPRTQANLKNLGRLLGRIDRALESFSHPAAHRELKWDLQRAAWIEDYLDYIEDQSRRTLVGGVLDRFKNERPLDKVRRSVIHGDANLHNVLVEGDEITGLIDFGDLHFGAPVSELAVACAYVLPEEMAALATGFEETFPLTDVEREVVPLLILTRLAVSVTNSAFMKTQYPDPYVTVSEKQAWETLERLAC
jgi:Ser/Thr protein kinase RdoA (MazF antagonist)